MTDLDRCDDEILYPSVSDEALEQSAGAAKMANPTLPSALICVPFAPKSELRQFGL